MRRGAEIRAIRKGMGFMQKTLAGDLGVTPETLNRWENGKKPVPERMLRFIRLMGDMHKLGKGAAR